MRNRKRREGEGAAPAASSSRRCQRHFCDSVSASACSMQASRQTGEYVCMQTHAYPCSWVKLWTQNLLLSRMHTWKKIFALCLPWYTHQMRKEPRWKCCGIEDIDMNDWASDHGDLSALWMSTTSRSYRQYVGKWKCRRCTLQLYGGIKGTDFKGFHAPFGSFRVQVEFWRIWK